MTRLRSSYQYWEPICIQDNKKALMRTHVDSTTCTCTHSSLELAQSVLAFHNFVYATTPIPNTSSAMSYTYIPCIVHDGMGASSWKPPASYLTPVILQLLLVCEHVAMLTKVGDPSEVGDNIINPTNNDCVRLVDSRKKNHVPKDDLTDMPLEVAQHDPATCKEDSECDYFHESNYDGDECNGVTFYCQSDEEDDESNDGDSLTSDVETDCLSEEGSIVFCPHAETKCSQGGTTFNPALKVVLSHTSSFSSEESGFCESNQLDWSDDEEDAEEIGTCELNNDLWAMFQDMSCFNSGTPKGNNREMTTFNDATPSHMTGDDVDILEDTLLSDDATLHHNQLASHASANGDVIKHNNDLTPTQTSQHLSLEQNNLHSERCKAGGKRVRFKPEAELVQVHLIVAWDFAYRNSRKGPWEELARDRDRFRRRIETLSKVLEPCLLRKVGCCNR